jgi:hypothetical protein
VHLSTWSVKTWEIIDIVSCDNLCSHSSVTVDSSPPSCYNMPIGKLWLTFQRTVVPVS